MTEKKPPRELTYTVPIKRDDIKEAIRSSERGPRVAHLTVIRGGQDLGIHAVIEGSSEIGRCPECVLSLKDLGVSWKHARVSPGPAETYVLEDAGSTNGTLVNGIWLDGEHTLRNGDKIVMGDTVVRFSLADDLDVDFQTEIASLVGTDPLTGLESKRRFDDALDFALQVAQRTGGHLAVFMMDLDGVKQINDKYGHFFGAHVICETGRIIAEHLGARGHASRFGGDEFSAYLPDLDRDGAMRAAEAIRVAVETAGMEKDGVSLEPTVSIGVACYPEDAEFALELVAHADAALYRAKAAGKNCVSM